MAQTTIKKKQIANPYKFHAYRSAALNTGAGIMPFDAERFDTNNNFDITTNIGRYTAPIAGFYFFSAVVTKGSGDVRIFANLYKNGSQVLRGVDITSGRASHVSGLIQLAANDYVEVYFYAASAVDIGVEDGALTTFTGYLVSTT